MAQPLTELTVITDAGVGKVTISEVQAQLGKLGLRIVSDRLLQLLEHARRSMPLGRPLRKEIEDELASGGNG